MKVMSIVGTRPELIKMSEIIKKLDKHTQHIFVHTGQNYDPQLKDVFFADLGLREPDYALSWTGDTLGKQLSANFTDVDEVLAVEKPDAVVILGDTNSAIAGGYLSKRAKIPLFHLEAGNRCFDQNVPEEINRRILDHTADVNMVYTENSRRYLLDEGVAKDRIFIMGSPMKEVLYAHRDQIKQSKILDTLDLKPGKYFVASLHRDENTNIQTNFNHLVASLNAVAEKYDMPVILSTHPRLMKKIEAEGVTFDDRVVVSPPFGFFDYIYLQAKSKCVISDSGTVAEESSILGFPAITIRNAIERPEAIDVGSILMSGVDKDSVLACLEAVGQPTTVPADYDIANCSERVLKVVLGYTNYINRFVWHKPV